jgi:hypothetical protein
VVYNSTIDRAEIYLNGSGWTVLSNGGTTFPSQLTSLVIHSSAGFGSSTLWAVLADGLYRVTAYMSVDTGAGAGSVGLTIGYTDANRSNTQVSPSLNTASATNTVTWSAMFWAANATNITVTTTNSGSSTYYCDLVVERLQ